MRRLVPHFSYPMPRKERASIAARVRARMMLSGFRLVFFEYGVAYQRNPKRRLFTRLDLERAVMVVA
jgi:hypothetical protein